MEEESLFRRKVEELQSRVQTLMLPVERKATECSLDCYKSGGTNYDEVHRCVQKCQKSVQGVAEGVQREFQALQGSAQSCMKSVQMRVEPKAKAATDASQQEALQKEFEQGAARCIKEASSTLPDHRSARHKEPEGSCLTLIDVGS